MGDTALILGEVFLDTLSYWWVIIPTIFLGLIVGGVPGFSAANTIIILMPLTLSMDLEMGLVFMVSLYCSARMGAGIPAILVNIPGTAGAAATPLDGYPMTQQGRGQQALAMTFVASSLGGAFDYHYRLGRYADFGTGWFLYAFGGNDRCDAVWHFINSVDCGGRYA